MKAEFGNRWQPSLVVGQHYGVSRDIMLQGSIDYVRVGIEGIVAFRKMIPEACIKTPKPNMGIIRDR